MTHLNNLVTALNSTAPIYFYLTLFFFAFLENLFPPSPSDLVIAFGGSLVGTGKLDIFAAIFFSTLGSTAGFVVMYYIGFFLGRELIDTGKLKFIPMEKIKTVEGWFQKYGYGIVVVNRFLSGTRAVISFFVGLSELSIAITIPLCAISALTWNSILIIGGSLLGRNWKQLGHILSLYGITVGIFLSLLVVFFVVKYYRRRKHA
ncbi:MAG TPA: DedA family protein [Candidatus Acidoferrales bacterium]|nr:DedA family protein [Candidatus Acidoferrales bacterium]